MFFFFNHTHTGSCTKESNNTRSSGLSTPSLNAIACHKKDNQESCYTINLGYVSHPSQHHQGAADHEPPAQFAPYQYHQDYLQQHPSLQVHHELSRYICTYTVCTMRDKSSMFLSAMYKNLIFLCSI